MSGHQLKSSLPLAAAALLQAAVTAGLADAGPAMLGIRALPSRLAIQLVGDGRPIEIVELRPYESYSADSSGAVVWTGPAGDREVSVSRFDGCRDRLYSKFQLVDAHSLRALGDPHWVDDLDGLPAWDFEMPWPQSKKGVSCPVDIEDLGALGARYADIGIVLAGVFDWSRSSPAETWEVDGERLPINAHYIKQFDAQIKRMTELGINVTLILVNGVPSAPDPSNPLINPRTDLANAPNHLGAFNLTDERGLRYYRAAVEYLAHRYSNPACDHGWVSGYVVGNELQSHWWWHNMGRAAPEEVVREYADQLRVAWLAVRRFHSGVRVYASMDHTWAARIFPDPMKSVRGDEFLERLNAVTSAEGAFPWDVAFHPYPENLFEPRFWNDRTAELGFDSPRVTFRNLEVLPAFLSQERFLYRGQPRRIILSEQGFHCLDGPDGELIQAAAYAYAYHKVSHMPSIRAFMLHRHVDHRDEGGLRLGLWTRALDATDPSVPDRKRFIWDVFRLADTDQWEEAIEFAKPIIGISDWAEALPFTGTIPETSGRFGPPLDPAAVVYSFGDHAADARLSKCLDWRTEWTAGPDGLMYPSLFHHPPDPRQGAAEAVFDVSLPRRRAGKRLAMRFGAALTGPTHDGVRMSVATDGHERWARTLTEQGEASFHTLDLTGLEGRSVEVALRVDALGDNAGDWAQWLQPVIVSESKR